MAAPPRPTSDMLSISTVIKNKWKIQGKIGQGAFGETYAGYDLHTGEEVAIKVERWDNKKMVLKLEVIALKKLQGCSHVVRYIHSGRQEDFNFLVMERLGENLAELRKRTPKGAFSLCTTLKLGIQMLDSIEGVHNLGYIHRDIKPSNFVIGRTYPKSSRTYLIDFGLARKYRLPSGEIRPPRKSAGFRGTARYASINSHQSKELSRRDDIWSLFYVLVEFGLGQLPWRKIKDKEHIGELKEKYTNAELVKDLPKEFLLFMEHLQKLGYADPPDYNYLRQLLLQVYNREGYAPDAPFDWETGSQKITPNHSRVSSDGRHLMEGAGSSALQDAGISDNIDDRQNTGLGNTSSNKQSREGNRGSAKLRRPSPGKPKKNSLGQEHSSPDYYNIFHPQTNPDSKRNSAPQPSARQGSSNAHKEGGSKKKNPKEDDDSSQKSGCKCIIL